MSDAQGEGRTEAVGEGHVHGYCHPDFSAVRDAFAVNFAERGEIGSCVAVYRDGEKVVDLWGGWRDKERTERWTEETFCSVYSISKSMCALGVHLLIDRGLIELEAPVADYWPQFGQAGKSGILIRHVLSHHCGVIFNDAAAPGDIYRWEAMIRAIEQQQPAWPAGTRGAYNSVNFGFIQGELIRRVDGRIVDEFLQDEVFRPLEAEFLFGAQSAGKRLADMIDNPANLQYRNAGSGESNVGRAWNAMPIPRNASMVNEGHRRALYPSGGGFTTARDLGRIYAMLANDGELDGVRILSQEAVDRLQQEQWQEQADGMMGMPMRMALGFMKNTPPGLPMGPNPDAFGHYGSNGALAFADRQRKIAFACTTNFVTAGTGVGDRTEALVAAVFRD
jgi:CubicO group peptidase (beta-lactamase class C family)